MAKYDIILNIKIDQEIKYCLEKMAEEQDMTTSAVVREILQQFFKKKNNLNDKQIYYYDHLLNEIINNKNRLNSIEFKAKFGKNPSIESIVTKSMAENVEDVTREYILSLLQNKKIKFEDPVLEGLIGLDGFTINTSTGDFDDIEGGIVEINDTNEEEISTEVHFKENEELIDLNAVEPRKVIKKLNQPN